MKFAIRDLHASRLVVGSFASLFATFVCSLGGCSDEALGRLELWGSVTLDSTPLDEGSIRFEPIGGATPVASGGLITAGSYRLTSRQGLPPGRYRVAIYAPEVAAAVTQEDAAAAAPPRERIPPQYNERTELEIEVNAASANQFDFSLFSSEG